MTRGALSPGTFARFYAPLAATSLLLTGTNPLLTSALSRSVNPAMALAGFSVSFALCGVLYSPLLVAQQVAATRLLTGRDFRTIQRFSMQVGLLFSALAAGAAFTPAASWIFSDLIGLTGDTFEEARRAMGVLWPVPFLTGLRAVHQGRLVAGHRTHPIALATGLRTGVLAVVAFGLTFVTSGAWLGAAAFTLGLLVEAILVAATPAGTGGEYHPVPAEGVEPPTTEDRILRFSTPLMANVLLWWSTPLIINALLARTPWPAEAIAAFVVVEAVAWFVTAPVGQFQHASIALVDCREAHRKVQRWSVVVAVAVSAVLGILALPPVRAVALGGIFQLDPGLLGDIGAALPLTIAYPILYGHRQYYQGLFIRAGRSDAVGWGAVLRVSTVLIVGLMVLGPLGRYGASLGVGLAVLGLVVEGLFLERISHAQVLPSLRPVPALSGKG